jgi:hypothetical protein
VEFVKEDVQRAVALMVAISQASYAFAPVAFGVIRSLEASAVPGQAPLFFIAAAGLQTLAIGGLLIGRNGRS